MMRDNCANLPRFRIPRRDRLIRIEQLLLGGMTNIRQIALTLGYSKKQTFTDLKRIEKRWSEEDRENRDKERFLRVRQIGHIGRLSIEEFERSKEDDVEVTVTEEKCSTCRGKGYQKIKDNEDKGMCRNCNGDGKEEHLPGRFKTCEDCEGSGREERVACLMCDGDGVTKKTTTKVRKQVGSAKHLAVAKSCIAEIARINDLYPKSVTMRQLSSDAKLVGGEIEARTEQLIIEAPVDMIIKAKAVLDELKQQVKEGKLETNQASLEEKKTIDVAAEKKG